MEFSLKPLYGQITNTEGPHIGKVKDLQRVLFFAWEVMWGRTFCLFWVVWKTPNIIAFEEEELNIEKLKISFVGTLKGWVKG